MKDVEKIVDSQISEVRSKGLGNENIDPRGKFHLDSSKISFHKERVDAWMRGERVAPITMDMAITQKCTYGCTFCYADLQKYPSTPAPWKVYENFLDDCMEIGHKPGEGVKAISLVSDGESTLSPHFSKFILKGKKNGINLACGTNGLALKKEELPELVNALTYLRFNFDAADSNAYTEIMGTTKKSYERVIKNIEDCVRLKNEQDSNITLGLQMVLLPEYADQVIPLALFGKEIGVDYTVIKHCSDDEKGSLGIDYQWYKGDLATRLLKTAESLSTDKYSVQAKWSKIRTGRDRVYSRCYGPPLFLQMSGSGIVAPCGSFFNPEYSKYHIGDIKKQRFKDIWASDRYWEVMNHLRSKKFDAKTDCASLCVQDKTNEILYKLVEKGESLQDISGKKTPMHMNFI